MKYKTSDKTFQLEIIIFRLGMYTGSICQICSTDKVAYLKCISHGHYQLYP